MFVRCLNYIKNHIPKQAEILEPISLQEDQGVIFESIMLAYLDISYSLILYTDSSDTQLEGMLVQVNPNTKEEKTFSTFSWKLNPAQLNYPATDNKPLGFVGSLKHFHNIIYGAKILVQMDHKNIHYEDAKHTSQHILSRI